MQLLHSGPEPCGPPCLPFNLARFQSGFTLLDFHLKFRPIYPLHLRRVVLHKSSFIRYASPTFLGSDFSVSLFLVAGALMKIRPVYTNDIDNIVEFIAIR
jgi:hypothetical protein